MAVPYDAFMYRYLVDGEWPLWMTTHPDLIQQELPREEWGDWRVREHCTVCIQRVLFQPSSTPASLVEWPHFSLCSSCCALLRHNNGLTMKRSHPRRALGRCISCGGLPQPSDLGHATTPVVLARAEEYGLTVAQLCTQSYCRDCNPRRKTAYCKSRICKQMGIGPHRALPRGCCTETSRQGSFVHCATACDRRRGQLRSAVARHRGKSAGESQAITSDAGAKPLDDETNMITPAAGGVLCRAEVCRLEGRGPHLGSQVCCSRARQVPHCSSECSRQLQVKAVANRRRSKKSP